MTVKLLVTVQPVGTGAFLPLVAAHASPAGFSPPPFTIRFPVDCRVEPEAVAAMIAATPRSANTPGAIQLRPQRYIANSDHPLTSAEAFQQRRPVGEGHGGITGYEVLGRDRGAPSLRLLVCLCAETSSGPGRDRRDDDLRRLER